MGSILNRMQTNVFLQLIYSVTSFLTELLKFFAFAVSTCVSEYETAVSEKNIAGTPRIRKKFTQERCGILNIQLNIT